MTYTSANALLLHNYPVFSGALSYMLPMSLSDLNILNIDAVL
jgi:hypothetical protein